ncbi:hypothetical protein UPYG_G00054580 [Umbra pygmaea]|uniref:Tripartite motif-containing protein 16-like n=1 Tax=Umbra pygmaea TaxID=75934 RepID=A0ABD0XVE1_UMBPY
MDSLSCSICLDLLKDPVTIPCGHSYCMDCIKGCFDQEDIKGIYSCPQCRQTFIPRPVLNRSTILTELVENLKKTRLQAAPPDHYYAGPGDVECDFCTGRKLKAVKSCLVCLASYCETHLQPHYESPAFKKHKLVQASTQLQQKICSHHDKLLEVYCRTDQQCICLLCTIDEHKGHDTVSAVVERTDKQRSAQAAVEDSERIFTELIRSIERRHSELKEKIRAQEKAEVSRAEGLLEKLEQEVSELRRRDVELEKLSHTEDHIQFLQSFQSLCVSPGSEVLPSITVYPHVSFDHVKKSVTEMKEQLLDLYKKEMDKISSKVTTVEIKQCVQPISREEFLTYSCQLTLDPNTAYKKLCLSEGNRMVTWSNKVQSYPDHPDRFTSYPRVGVYLDHRAGTLSFYSVSDTMTLLHRVQTTFTQPLYPGFYVYDGTSVEILTTIQ